MECQTKFFTNFKSDQMWKNEIFLTTFPVNEFSCNIWTHISFHIRMHIKWNAHHFLIPFRRLNAVLFWWPFIFRVQSFSQALCCNFSLSGVLFLFLLSLWRNCFVIHTSRIVEELAHIALGIPEPSLCKLKNSELEKVFARTYDGSWTLSN